jgi:hypothetical protein
MQTWDLVFQIIKFLLLHILYYIIIIIICSSL